MLLHGFTGCSGDWRQVFALDELARRYQLIVPDARGHGRSTNPDGTFTHRACAQDDLRECRKAIGIGLGFRCKVHEADIGHAQQLLAHVVGEALELRVAEAAVGLERVDGQIAGRRHEPQRNAHARLRGKRNCTAPAPCRSFRKS